MSATKNTILAVVVLVLTFGAGLVGGAAAHHIVSMRRPGPPPPLARAIVRHLDRRLELSDAQRAQIEAILARSHDRMRAQIDATNAEIERVLTPEQRAKFRKMRMRLHGPHGRRARPRDKE